jgi:outer membrane immunogenic protein
MRIATLLVGLAAAAAAIGGARASDLYPPMQPAPAYNPAAFNFNGFYLGAQGGALLGSTSGGELGVVAGANFDIASTVVAGLEFQGDWLAGSSSTATYDFFVLGRLGVVVSDSFMAYADIGPGWIGGAGSYAVGGGGEYALTDALSVKGEVLGTGAWGASPSNAKVQAGLLFHLQ